MADFLELSAAAELADGLAVMAAKGLLILLVVTLACIALRNAPAALKHLCWGLGLGAILILPFLSVMVPEWNVGVLPQNVAPAESETLASAWGLSSSSSASSSAHAARASEAGLAGSGASRISDGHGSAEAASSRNGVNAGAAAVVAESDDSQTATTGSAIMSIWLARAPIAFWFLGIWALGAAAILIHMFVCSIAVWRLVSKARPVTDQAWLDTLEELRDRFFIQRPVQLLESPAISVPIAWGAIRPVILIPPGAESWSDERRRCVLAHELAHVKRWDTLTQSVARAACALHWFNPLAWKAARAMQLEREKACDDYVLTTSRARASEYAGHLLDIARRVPGSLSPPVGAIAMARRSQLEGRVLAILDEGRRRSLARLPVVLTIATILLVVVPIAAMSPFEAPRSAEAEPLLAEPLAPGTMTIDGRAATSQMVANAEPAAPEAAVWSEKSSVATLRDDVERTFNVADGGLLVIDADHGNIKLNSGASGKVHVSVRRKPRGNADVSDYEVTFKQDGDRISVVGTNTVRNSGRTGVNVDFVVTVPRRFNIDAETAGGNIAVDNMDGRVKLNTSGGNLSLGRISGEVSAHTSGGNISLDGSDADVDVNTSGGNISLGRVGGTVRATTSGGNISVDEVNGEITAKTSGGQISARIARQPKADCLLRTSGGSITVYLADNVAVDLEAETSAGHVDTDVEVAAIGRIKKDRLHGKINGGGPLLELDTSAGDIHIKRL